MSPPLCIIQQMPIDGSSDRKNMIYSQTYIKRSPLGERKSSLLRQTAYLLKEVQFTWNWIWQVTKKGTFQYRWLLNRSDRMCKFDCIFVDSRVQFVWRVLCLDSVKMRRKCVLIPCTVENMLILPIF